MAYSSILSRTSCGLLFSSATKARTLLKFLRVSGLFTISLSNSPVSFSASLQENSLGLASFLYTSINSCQLNGMISSRRSDLLNESLTLSSSSSSLKYIPPDVLSIRFCAITPTSVVGRPSRAAILAAASNMLSIA